MQKERYKIFVRHTMTKIDKIMRQIKLDPFVSIFPPKCGICGKINKNFLCSKCKIQIQKELNFNIIKINSVQNNTKNIKDKFFDELMYVFKYQGQIRSLILDYKFNEVSYLYLTFVNFLLKNENLFENIKKYDKIIPVPISRNRLKIRGYNQSLLIAKEIANKTNLDLVNNCLFKTKNIIEQSKLNKEDREKNIQGVYELKNKRLIKDKKILLVDDIYTTGSTVNECSRVLLQGSPAKIGVLVLAKD